MLMPAGYALLQPVQLASPLLAGDLSVVEQWLETLLVRHDKLHQLPYRHGAYCELM